ncbi:DUF2750 domain-containing protein [Kordia sp.]|uniref:DUF2750 domain-containing protein n=1 Tax=Kordia sp. TaxID=1965332 RepID=UPI0025C66900|nr:DUF2750 domain-containing protein [Kordia sp.]MCH2193813.1 DUF2750 domain-containing protein [Kordia sp.]
MFQDSALIKQRHTKFISTVCTTEIVSALKNRKGFATTSSNHYDDVDGNPVEMICFWAEKARVKSCIKGEWKSYKTQQIQLTDFLENWCLGMENDGLLIGTEFDQNMFGYEAEPTELIFEIIQGLKKLEKELSLKKFKGIFDLEQQVKDILS